jgi:hypothetical protein
MEAEGRRRVADRCLRETNTVGFIAQQREGFFVSCWYLFDEERHGMWKEYGRDGVAVRSRYGLLRDALNASDERTSIGLVRYGGDGITRWNTWRFMTTKGRRRQ